MIVAFYASVTNMRASEPCKSQCEPCESCESGCEPCESPLKREKKFNNEYYYQTAANTVQITVQIFSDIVQVFEQ